MTTIRLGVLTVLAALAGLAVPASAAAQPAAAVPAVPLAVAGRVVEVTSRWDTPTRTIVTYVEVAVSRHLRGAVPDRVVLKQLGGEVGGIGLFVAGQARFVPGEETVLLLAVSPRDGTLHTAGLGRGKQPLNAATLAAVAAMPAADPAATVVAVPAEYTNPTDPPAFSLLPTDGGYPARWHEVDDDGIVFVDYPSALPGSWTGSTANVTAAINLWRGSGMELDLRQGNANVGAGVCPNTFTGNGRIAVAYNDPCGIADTAETWVVGGGYYTTGDLRTVNGVTYQKFVQGFVVLNNAGPQTSSAGCFQDAITHGLGHALGLGHSTSSGAMMQTLPAASCNSGPRGLAADDLSGITSIYQGIPSGPSPPGAPTALTASAALSTVSLSWTAATTGGAVQRYLVDAGTASGVYNIGTFTLNQTTTTAVFTGVPPGVYFLRVRAQNLGGTSAPSPEAQVTVGACTPPGPPGLLSGTTNNQNVTLNWSAPGSDVVQGYRLIVGSAPGAANLLVQDYPATVTSIAAAGVAYGTYYARVAATNVCGVGPTSNEVTLVVQPCAGPPQAPTGFNFALSGSFVSMAWAAPAAGPAPSSYLLVVGSQTGGSDVLVFDTGSTATTTGAPAPPGTYYVRVVAQNACGLSGASNEIVVVVP
ncbi:MAG: matrixin family metalloprotease [Vicinamibacterales bacterium]